MQILPVVLIPLLQLLTFATAQTGLGKQGFNELCVQDSALDSELCIASKHLVCAKPTGEIDYRCGCDNHMHYDINRQRCVVKAGERCLESVDDGRHPTTCTGNATCIQHEVNEEGYCACTENFIPNDAAECKMTYLARDCINDADCEKDSFLKCDTSFGRPYCLCGQERTIWGMGQVSNKMTCLSRSGGNCSSTQVPAPVRSCVAHSDCTSDGHCLCQPNYIETADFQCRLDHNQACSLDTECHPTFKCLVPEEGAAKTCGCAAGKTLVDNKCLTLADQFDCNAVNPCVAHATCYSNSSAKYCVCDTGYSSSRNGICLTDYGFPCDSANICNAEDKLICIDGQCDCIENYAYKMTSASEGHCAAKVDQTCDPNDGLDACVSFNCSDSGSCQCRNGTIPAADKTECFTKFGTPCSANGFRTERCDPTGHLECFGLCDCEIGFAFSNISQSCLGYIGTKCLADADCTHNAVCSAVGKCECGVGFKYTFGGCKADYGIICDDITIFCNEEQNLACSGSPSDPVGSRKCECQHPDDQVYDDYEGFEQCVGKVGSDCFGFGSYYCIQNTSCIIREDISVCECDYDYVENGLGGCYFKVIGGGGGGGSSSVTDLKPTVAIFSYMIVVLTCFSNLLVK